MFKCKIVQKYNANINKCLKRLIQTDTQCLGDTSAQQTILYYAHLFHLPSSERVDLISRDLKLRKT